MTDSDATQRDDGTSASEASVAVRDTAEAPEASVSSHPTDAAGEASAPEPAPTAPADPAPATNASDVDAGAPDVSGAPSAVEAGLQREGVPQGAEGETPASTDEVTEGAEAAEGVAKKKKRRRRRKKKGGAAEGTPATEGEAKSAAHVPFFQYFEGATSKKHAFTAGEVVAGRVTKVGDGTVVVDLFGKATAFVDVHEPHEVPVVTESVSEEAEDAASTEAEDLAAAGEHASPEGVHPTGEAPEDTVPEGAGVDASAVASAVAEAEGAPEAAGSESTEGAGEPTDTEGAAPTHASEAAPESPMGPPQGGAEPSEPVPGEASAAAEATPAAPVELPPSPPPEPPAVGSIFRGRVGSVSESGHIAIVNRIVDRAAAKERLRVAQQEHRRVEGVVYGFNRGGFDVLMEGIRVFCPAAAMALEPIDDPHPFLGRKMEFTVAPTKGGGKSIIVSRRTILEKELRKKARERMKKLIVGERLDGRVTEVRDYGLIVDIGEGLDGLVHLSEVSWNRADKPADVAKVGDEVEVEVIKLTPASRKDRFGRVSLSMRRCQRDPWDLVTETLREGAAFKGKVVRAAEFGAFIEIAPGVEGLLHISELGGKDLTHAKQAVSEGDEIDVAIERIDRGQRRISLSRLSEADLEAIASGEFEPSKAPKSLKAGSHVEVLVERVEHHGLFVQVVGVLGRRGRGYVSNRELGDSGEDRRRAYAPGTKLDVKIVGADRNGQLRCSIKALQIDEERKAVKDYRKEAARQGFGTFGDLLKAKLERDGK